MKKFYFFGFLLITVFFEIFLIFKFCNDNEYYKNDVVKINELVNEIQISYKESKEFPSKEEFYYAVLNENYEVVFKSHDFVRDSLNDAYKYNDTVVDFSYDDGKLGKVIVYNNFEKGFSKYKMRFVGIISFIVFVQFFSFIVYYFYLYRNILKPFKKMNSFASRVAHGNLDVPLEMDRNNNFGAFTEAFDVMRCEISKSRAAEKNAIEAKKELVAKLSHDIKTPISSIKSYSELGLAISNEQKSKEYFESINHKSDQMSTMITNLFNSTLEELEELEVCPSSLSSSDIVKMIVEADYLDRSCKFDMPKCCVFADKLRLQQVFDNVFANSYKYADTDICTNGYLEDDFLVIEINDFGDKFISEELPLFTEKFKRGSNTSSIDGAGLGLYISKELLKQMNGDLEIMDANPGFKVVIYLRVV